MHENLATLKETLLKRKKDRAFPRRSALIPAMFTEANEHNPLVHADCSHCRGTGRTCEVCEENGVRGYGLGECEVCDGTGLSPDGRIEPCFPNTLPPVEVTIRTDGWLTCPCCGKTFSTNDSARWTGLRHITCGQRIIRKPAPSP